jgi:hypothetical protein
MVLRRRHRLRPAVKMHGRSIQVPRWNFFPIQTKNTPFCALD